MVEQLLWRRCGWLFVTQQRSDHQKGAVVSYLCTELLRVRLAAR